MPTFTRPTSMLWKKWRQFRSPTFFFGELLVLSGFIGGEFDRDLGRIDRVLSDVNSSIFIYALIEIMRK